MNRNFSTQLLENVNNSSDKTAIQILLDGEYKSITYQELLFRSSSYERELKNSGIGLGDVVILILPHGLDLVYAYFGAILNGSIPSIMPYLTEKLIPDKYRQDLHSLIEITRPSAVITYKGFQNELTFLDSIESSVKATMIAEEIPSDVAQVNVESFDGIKRLEKEIALLQHSSGTTGLQKGVALSFEAIFNQLESYREALKLNEKDVIVSWLPLYHDMGLIAGFLLPILFGIPLVLMSPFEWVRAPYKLMHAISEFKGTLCWLPNFAYNFCAKKIRERDLEQIDLSSLRAVINCSEPMRKASHELFFNKFHPYGFRKTALATSYAMAENVFAVTQGGIDKQINYDEIDLIAFQEERVARPVKSDDKKVVMVSAGKPIIDTKVKIIDKDGNTLPERHIGEIVINSNCMLTEYYNREDATSSSFIDGWFMTGDLGYLTDSELYISGRKKDLIIVGGKNIYPKDLETITMEVKGVHPGRVVAFGVYNENKGTEDVVIIAEIEDGFADKKTEISGKIREKVTRESAIALRNVLLVDKKWLIKTSSGKIARALNKEKYLKQIK